MENADSALNEVNQVLQRVRELVVQASNDSYEVEARKNIEKEISRLQEHIVALANTRVGENYIFNGTDTANPPINETMFTEDYNMFLNNLNKAAADPDNAEILPDDYVISYKGQVYRYAGTDADGTVTYAVMPKIQYKVVDVETETEETREGYAATIQIDSSGSITHTFLQEEKNLRGSMIEKTEQLADNKLVISRKDAVSTNTQPVEIEVMKGVKIPININSNKAFSIDMFSGIESIKKMLTDPDATGAEITKALDSIDKYLNDIVSARSELGAQINRAEMVESRLLEQKVVAEETVSNNEDIEFEEAIIQLMIQESIHRASLATGARIIQPTLMDFLR